MYDFPRSVSQRRAYRKCGYLWYLRYAGGWKSRTWKGTWAFGTHWQTAIQAFLEGKVSDGQGINEVFQEIWAPLKDDPGITWNKTASWQLLATRAVELAKVSADELGRVIGQPGDQAIYDRRFEYPMTSHMRETAIPDYLGPCAQRITTLEGELIWGEKVWSVLDFKTSDRDYKELRVEGDEQLSNYQQGSEIQYPKHLVEQVGLVVFIYAVKPRVQWLLAPRRTPAQLAKFTASAIIDDQHIKAEEFGQNRDACLEYGGCEMIPICYPSQAHRIDTELVRLKDPAVNITLLESNEED